MAIELSIVIPTYNEKGNIRPLLDKIDAALSGIAWEAIFVDDDSPDGTAEAVRQVSLNDTRVRCLQRIGRRGLSSACIEGMLSSSADYLAVMDADLQHDSTLLPKMLEALKTGEFDLTVGSRYVEGGGVGQWSSQRSKMSVFATWLTRLLIKVDLKDPMSGYFMLKRAFFHRVARQLSGRGFKILMDIYTSSPQEIRIKEFPFQFGQRLSGKSKLNPTVPFEFVIMILTKLPGRFSKTP